MFPPETMTANVPSPNLDHRDREEEHLAHEEHRKLQLQNVDDTIVGWLAHRVQKQSGYTSRRGELLTRSLHPGELLNELGVPGYRRKSGLVWRNDIAYLRRVPLPNATTRLVFESKTHRATLPIDEESIGHLGNLLRGRVDGLKLGWQCRRAIDHACGPYTESRTLEYLEDVATLFDVPLKYHQLDGTLVTVVGPTMSDRQELGVMYYRGYWFELASL